jgi:hypothetical protein
MAMELVAFLAVALVWWGSLRRGLARNRRAARLVRPVNLSARHRSNSTRLTSFRKVLE